MRRLRSPWTIVALVPVFFLASFTIVSALAGGGGSGAAGPGTQPLTTEPDEPPEAAAEPGTTEESPGAEPEPVEETPSEEPSEAAAPPTVTGLPTYVPPPAPNDSGAPPPGPPKGVIEVEYGEWADRFRISNTKLVPEYGSMTVTGKFRYLGGGSCQPGNVEVRGLFYDDRRIPVGQGFWETEWRLGKDAIPVQKDLAMEVYGMVRREAVSATLRILRVNCR